MIQVKGLHIALPVRDMLQTVDFYSALFGMVVLYRTQYYGHTFVMMALGEHRVSFLERPDNVPSPPWVSRSGENPLHIGFLVEGPAQIESTLEECNRLGVQVVIGPRDREDVNERAIYCIDPSGYQVEVYCENKE